jgi:hypothetical protein
MSINNPLYKKYTQVDNPIHQAHMKLDQPNATQAYGRLVTILDDSFSLSKLVHKVAKKVVTFFTNIKNAIFKPSEEQKLTNLQNKADKLHGKLDQMKTDLYVMNYCGKTPEEKNLQLSDSQIIKSVAKQTKLESKLNTIESTLNSMKTQVLGKPEKIMNVVAAERIEQPVEITPEITLDVIKEYGKINQNLVNDVYQASIKKSVSPKTLEKELDALKLAMDQLYEVDVPAIHVAKQPKDILNDDSWAVKQNLNTANNHINNAKKQLEQLKKQAKNPEPTTPLAAIIVPAPRAAAPAPMAAAPAPMAAAPAPMAAAPAPMAAAPAPMAAAPAPMAAAPAPMAAAPAPMAAAPAPMAAAPAPMAAAPASQGYLSKLVSFFVAQE